MSSHLKGDKVDVSLIQSIARNSLINLIEKYEGTKAILVDQALDLSMGLIMHQVPLKKYGVKSFAPLDGVVAEDVKHVIIITRPKISLMHAISNIILTESTSKQKLKKSYHLYFVPRKSLLCINRLAHRGVQGNFFSVEEMGCNFFPFDSDVISLEVPELFREYNLENDSTCLYQVAQSILFLQSIYGPISHVWGKGAAAKQVWDFVLRLQRENENEDTVQQNHNSCIDQIILIDRSIDLISPLATQLTYEGLIDEIYGINSNTVKIPSEKFLSLEERQTESLREVERKIILDSSDQLFADLRDKNFSGVATLLSKQAKLIGAQMENRHEKTVQEMKLFVQRLPQLIATKKALAQHTAIAETIKEVTDSNDFLESLQIEQEFLNCTEVDKVNPYIEDMIAQKKPLVKVLRLICLQCLTSSGLKPKLLEYYKRELVQVYGLEALSPIINLEKVGLIRSQSGTRQYTVLRKALRLTVEDTSEINPTDISYVHCIYAPLSVRLTEQLTKNGGWRQLQDVLGLLPGPTLDESPQIPNSDLSASGHDSPKVVLVYFIGGCTFAEISALRFLSQQEDSNVEFVIATTKLINGNTFLESIMSP